MTSERRLQAAAQKLIAAADRGQSVAPLLTRLCPDIARQIRRDRRHPTLFAAWGRCANVDENVGKTIVHPPILEAIGNIAGVPMRGRFVHAGLQHTYGYLFSVLETPYGRKRDRWISTSLERGFGIDESLLGERPRQGTLLANLTWFLGQIVHRGRQRRLRALERIAAVVAPELVEYDLARLAVCRIVEETALPGSRRGIKLFTDLVRYPVPSPKSGGDAALLVYSVQNGIRSRIKLITAFPVNQQTVSDLKTSVVPGKVEVRLRYNAYVPGFYGRTLSGRRFFAEGDQLVI